MAQTFSFRAIDVGFDLRLPGRVIERPVSIGYPGEVVRVVYDGPDGEPVTREGRPCDCGAALRRAGYSVSPAWFAGRANWGQPVVITTAAEDCATFAQIKAYTDWAHTHPAEAAAHETRLDAEKATRLAARGFSANRINEILGRQVAE